MADQEQPLKRPEIHPWRYLPILIILGLAAYLFVPQITSLENSWLVVQRMIWWAVALAAIAQVFSYLGSGFMLHAILDHDQNKLSVWKGALITMAAFSVGLVAGGWVGTAAATYGWIRRENHDENTAALAGALPPLLNDSILVSVASIGTIYLLVVHYLSNTQLIEFRIVLLVLGLLAAGGVVTIHTPDKINRFIVWLARQWAALRHKPFTPNKTIASVKLFIAAWDSFRKGNWWRPLLGTIANIGFGMLTLYFMFTAAGYIVSLGFLFAGYGLPFMLARIVFILPGGVGVVEASIMALYSSLKVPSVVSVVVILGYRLFSWAHSRNLNWVELFMGNVKTFPSSDWPTATALRVMIPVAQMTWIRPDERF